MRKFVLALLVTAGMLTQTTAWAQYTMPLRRVASAAANPDLRAGGSMHITDPVFEDDGGDIDTDDLLAYQATSLLSSLSLTETTSEVVCTTAINASDSVGEVDGTFTGDILLTDPESHGYADSGVTGIVDFEVEAHPMHPDLNSFTLRANLWAMLITNVQNRTGGNGTTISVSNLDSGRNVTLTVVRNFATGQWDWTKDDGDGNVDSGSGETFNELFYVEHDEVEVGDTIRVSVRGSYGVGTFLETINGGFSSKATAWFDVVGTEEEE